MQRQDGEVARRLSPRKAFPKPLLWSVPWAVGPKAVRLLTLQFSGEGDRAADASVPGAAMGARLGLWVAGAESAGAAVNDDGAPVLGQGVCGGSHFLLTPAPLYRGGGLFAAPRAQASV